jgi:lysophospholipase L1-like esterase
MALRIRHLAFAAAAITIAVVVTMAAVLGADLYLHKRAERSAGLNIWGYRGPVVGRKRPGEVRVAVLGGSTVFGYGLTWDQAFPVLLEQKLNAASSGRPRFSVVNLGYNNEGAYSFRFTLQDYAYLQPDVVCLYEGYNDLMGDANGGNPSIYRHNSPLFRAVGYFPILPMVLHEKALAMRYGGDLSKAYAAEGRTVFQPTLTTKATSGALDAAASIGESIEQQIARLGTEKRPPVIQAGGAGCAHPWSDYCQGVSSAIDDALAAGRRVLFVTQPYLTGERGRDRHIWQQRAVLAMLQERYAGRRDVQHVNLGEAIDLREPSLATDGMHLTPTGNARIAERLVQPILALSLAAPDSVRR